MSGQSEGNITIHAIISVNRLVPYSTLLGALQHSRLNDELIPTTAKPETMAIQATLGAILYIYYIYIFIFTFIFLNYLPIFLNLIEFIS